MDECVRQLAQVYEKIRAYLISHPDEKPPLSVEVSQRLLKGFVPDNYRDLLSAYRQADV
jgi:hypothetical protein